MSVQSALPAEDLDRVVDTVGEADWRSLAGARLFLTGGTGFVGKWLMSALIEADRRFGLKAEMTVLSRDPEAFAAAAPALASAPRVALLRGDVRSFVPPDGRFSHVIHAATDVVAQNSPRETFATCVEGTRRTLDFAVSAGASEFLLVSSGAVYGAQPPALERLSEAWMGAPDPLAPASAYGEGKRVSEWLAAVQALESGLSPRVARCFAFVGPYLPLDKRFAIGNFLRDAMSGEPILIQGDGTPCRTYLHAADMAGWLWATLFRGRKAVAYNVGGDEVTSIAGLAKRIVGVLGSSAEIRILKSAPPGPASDRYVPDTNRARAELRLPEPLSLDEAIARTARWHGYPVGLR